MLPAHPEPDTDSAVDNASDLPETATGLGLHVVEVDAFLEALGCCLEELVFPFAPFERYVLPILLFLIWHALQDLV